MFTIERYSTHELELYAKNTDWLPEDVLEVKDMCGLGIEHLIPRLKYDSYIFKYKGIFISFASIDNEGKMTYFTTNKLKEVPFVGYTKYMKEKLEMFMDLNECQISTAVTREHTQAIRFLGIIGFKHWITKRDRLIYGKRNKDI